MNKLKRMFLNLFRKTYRKLLRKNSSTTFIAFQSNKIDALGNIFTPEAIENMVGEMKGMPVYDRIGGSKSDRIKIGNVNYSALLTANKTKSLLVNVNFDDMSKNKARDKIINLLNNHDSKVPQFGIAHHYEGEGENKKFILDHVSLISP